MSVQAVHCSSGLCTFALKACHAQYIHFELLTSTYIVSRDCLQTPQSQACCKCQAGGRRGAGWGEQVVGGDVLHWRVGWEQVGRDPLDPVPGREQELRQGREQMSKVHSEPPLL